MRHLISSSPHPLIALVFLVVAAAAQQPSPLDRYIEEAQRASTAGRSGSGSLWAPEGPLGDLARDNRARLVNDILTILVVEQATAQSRGSTESSRKSGGSGGLSSIFGRSPTSLATIANVSGSTQLAGQGTTSRESAVSTRLSARVSHVLPNGYLVVEGHKEVVVNSERQLVAVRGVVRPADLLRDNSVRSDRLAQMEIRINGKGVVQDAIRRPFFLYRLLMGLLP